MHFSGGGARGHVGAERKFYLDMSAVERGAHGIDARGTVHVDRFTVGKEKDSADGECEITRAKGNASATCGGDDAAPVWIAACDCGAD